jgi:hypothetical protein
MPNGWFTIGGNDLGSSMNTFQRLAFFLTTFFSLLLGACTSTVSPGPTLSPSPAQPSRALEPTRTAAPISPSLTTSPKQLTAAAQLTHVANSRTTATVRAAIQTANAPAPTPTPTIPAAELLELLESIRKPEEVWTATSPDGHWSATIINQICADLGDASYIYYQIKFSRTDSSEEWVFYEEVGNCGLGYTLFSPVGWSSNSRYLYYAAGSIPDGCPAYFGESVSHIDIETRTSASITYVTDESLSPDQSLLAMSVDQDIVLWDTDNHESVRTAVQANETDISHIVWSPDSQSFIATALEHDCGLVLQSSIIRFDLPDFTQTVLVLSDIRGFVSIEWKEDLVRLYSTAGKSYWLLNPRTGEVTPSP